MPTPSPYQVDASSEQVAVNAVGFQSSNNGGVSATRGVAPGQPSGGAGSVAGGMREDEDVVMEEEEDIDDDVPPLAEELDSTRTMILTLRGWTHQTTIQSQKETQINMAGWTHWMIGRCGQQEIGRLVRSWPTQY